MSSTCKNCRYWGSYRENECDRINGIARGEAVAADGAEVYAEALDDSGLEFGLVTGPDFGCVKFEAKEAK